MRNWDDIVGKDEAERTSRPRIMEFIESFERKHKEIMKPDELAETAIYAAALYLFGPAEDEDLLEYVSLIKKRVLAYRQSIH